MCSLCCGLWQPPRRPAMPPPKRHPLRSHLPHTPGGPCGPGHSRCEGMSLCAGLRKPVFLPERPPWGLGSGWCPTASGAELAPPANLCAGAGGRIHQPPSEPPGEAEAPAGSPRGRAASQPPSPHPGAGGSQRLLFPAAKVWGQLVMGQVTDTLLRRRFGWSRGAQGFELWTVFPLEYEW